MTIAEAKKQAIETGDCEIGDGVWLDTGASILKDTPRDGLDTDIIAVGYLAKDIIPDQLYIMTDTGDFFAADDEDIGKVLGVKYQVQFRDYSVWSDLVADQYGNEIFDTISAARILEQEENERYPFTETRIVSSESDDWMDR